MLACWLLFAPLHPRAQFAPALVKQAIEKPADSTELEALLLKIREGKVREGAGYADLVQAIVLTERGDGDRALPLLLKARETFVDNGDRRGELYASRFISANRTALKATAEARPHSRRCIALATELNDPMSLGNCLLNLAIAERLNNEYDSAFYLIRQALGLFAKHNAAEAGHALMNLGSTHHHLDNLDSAMFYYYKAVGILEAHREFRQLAGLYNNMSIIATNVKDFRKAKELSYKSITLRKTLKDDWGLAANYNSLGNIYQELQQYDSAALMFGRALEIHFEKGDKPGILRALNNAGSAAYYNGEYARSFDFFQRGLEMAIAVGDSIEIARTYSNNGWSLLQLNRTTEAKEYFEKGLETALKLRALDTRQVAYTGMSDYYLAIKDFESALKYYTLSRDVLDKILNEKRMQQFAEMQTRYETEQKEKEITRLSLAQSEAELSLARQRMFIGSLITGILALLGVGWGLYYRRQKRAEAQLAAKELEYRKQLLDATVLAEENERQRIAKDMHDGLVQSLAVIRMGLQQAERKTGLGEALAPEIAKVDEAIREARNLSHQMMPRTLMEMGLVAALDDMLAKTLENAGIRYTFEHFGLVQERFNKNIEIGLYRIAQELVNNILKHSGATEIILQLYQLQNHLVLHLEDNGKGFTLSDPGIKSGIGLTNIFSRASAVNGEVSYEEGQPGGTVVNVRVPVAKAESAGI